MRRSLGCTRAVSERDPELKNPTEGVDGCVGPAGSFWWR